MESKPTLQQEVHVNPYEQAVKDHVPTAGDYYADRNPHFNSRSVFQLQERTVNKWGAAEWKVRTVCGPRKDDTVPEKTLRQHYRPLLGEFGKTLMYAEYIVAGKADKVTKELLPSGNGDPAESEALMASGSRSQIAALLDESERRQAQLEEIHHLAQIIIENKKAELEARLSEMNGILSEMNKKVGNLVKVITVLNLYTGKTVDIQQIADGQPADQYELLSLRQRILYMDEELCAELDHEADYNDIPLFLESLKNPAFLDIIAPEQKCVVALKAKRHEMGYRSGDPYYDHQREVWNKHTWLVLRNGGKVYVLDSEDLELWDWAFPHSNFEEEFQKKISDPTTSFKDSLRQDHEQARYRTTKYMVFLQGVIDSNPEILGPFKTAPNIMKHQGIELVRDDENLLGTGRESWNAFRERKNRTIRRGTRLLYDGGQTLRDGCTQWNSGGEFPKYYAYKASEPAVPAAGIYHADSYERVDHYEHGKPVVTTAPYLVFRYLPGDEVWKRNAYGYTDLAERTRKVAWKYEAAHVLNYDDVTVEEIQGYLSDRTLRTDFRGMMPLLKRALLEKKAEQAEEEAFKELLASEYSKTAGKDCPAQVIDEAVEWWKGKVIFTRPLRSDDAKAFRMILTHLKNSN